MHRLVLFTFIFLVGACAGIDIYADLDVFDEVYIRQLSGRVRKVTYDSPPDTHSAVRDPDTADKDPESANQDPDSDKDYTEPGDGSSFVFPEKMTFSFTIKQINVRLDLLLNELQRSHVPINLVTKDGIYRYRRDTIRDYAFYQVLGEETGASVMVRCPDFNYPCSMTGQFRVGNEEYLVEPNSQKPKLVSKSPHKIYKLENTGTGSYRGDTIVNYKEEEDLYDQEPERKKRETGVNNYKVELNMVIDSTIYSYWLKRRNNVVSKAIDTIEEYFEQVANTMDIHFSSLTSSSMSIDIIPREITIITSSSEVDFITNNYKLQTDGSKIVDGNGVLEDIWRWTRSDRYTYLFLDATIVFTRQVLHFSYGNIDTDAVITINGKFRQTIHGSHLWRIFTGDVACPRDERGSHFLDRDGPTFRHILNYLRSDRLTVPSGFREFDLLKVEADYYGIEALVQEVDALLQSRKRSRRRPQRKKTVTSQSVQELHRVHERNGNLYISDEGSDWFYD